MSAPGPGLVLLDAWTALNSNPDEDTLPAVYLQLFECFGQLGVVELEKHFAILAGNTGGSRTGSKDRSSPSLPLPYGQLVCWGENQNGCLARTTNNSPTRRRSSNGQAGSGEMGNVTIRRPTPIPTLENFHWQDVSCGLSHCVAVTDTGDVIGWGQNSNKQLEPFTNTSTDSRYQYLDDQQNPKIIDIPKCLLLGKKIRAVACGAGHTLCVSEDGRVFGWGLCGNGQLGNYDFVKNKEMSCGIVECKVETKIDNSNFFSGIACGFAHSLFLTKDGSIYGCGWNVHGQVGTMINQISTKAGLIIPKLTKIELSTTCRYQATWQHISCGGAHTLIVSADGKLFGFGCNSVGQLGLVETREINVDPTEIALPSVVSCVPDSSIHNQKPHVVTVASCGEEYSFCITKENLVFGWGLNNVGQLCLPIIRGGDFVVPTLIPALSDRKIEWICSTQGKSVALTGDGNLIEWGMGFEGIAGTVENIISDDLYHRYHDGTMSESYPNNHVSSATLLPYRPVVFGSQSNSIIARLVVAGRKYFCSLLKIPSPSNIKMSIQVKENLGSLDKECLQLYYHETKSEVQFSFKPKHRILVRLIIDESKLVVSHLPFHIFLVNTETYERVEGAVEPWITTAHHGYEGPSEGRGGGSSTSNSGNSCSRRNTRVGGLGGIDLSSLGIDDPAAFGITTPVVGNSSSYSSTTFSNMGNDSTISVLAPDSGLYDLHCWLGATPISNSPFPLQIGSGDICFTRCSATMKSYRRISVGSIGRFYIHSKDECGNFCSLASGQVKIEAKGEIINKLNNIIPGVSTEDFHVQFSPICYGKMQVSIVFLRMGRKHVTVYVKTREGHFKELSKGLWDVTVGEPDGLKSDFRMKNDHDDKNHDKKNWKQSLSIIEAGTPFYGIVTLRDQFGNLTDVGLPWSRNAREEPDTMKNSGDSSDEKSDEKRIAFFLKRKDGSGGMIPVKIIMTEWRGRRGSKSGGVWNSTQSISNVASISYYSPPNQMDCEIEISGRVETSAEYQLFLLSNLEANLGSGEGFKSEPVSDFKAVPAAPHPYKCRIKGIDEPSSLLQRTIDLLLFDTFGNKVPIISDSNKRQKCEIIIEKNMESLPIHVNSNTNTGKEPNVYSISVNLPSPGEYHVIGMINGERVLGSPFVMIIGAEVIPSVGSQVVVGPQVVAPIGIISEEGMTPGKSPKSSSSFIETAFPFAKRGTHATGTNTVESIRHRYNLRNHDTVKWKPRKEKTKKEKRVGGGFLVEFENRV